MPLETMLKVLEMLHQHIQGKWERIRFTILGGEPTINPYLLDFCKRAADLGHIVLIDSNASRTAEYYLSLFKIVGELRFSIHLDYIETESFYRKMKTLIAGISEVYAGSRAVIVLKYMMQPGKLEIIRALQARLQTIPEFSRIVWIEFSVLNSMVPGDSGLLDGYTEEDFSIIENPMSLQVSIPTPQSFAQPCASRHEPSPAQP